MRRLFYVDAFRAFLVVLVVLGHAIQTAVPEFDRNVVFRGIYSFHMAAFMFVSGFVNWREGRVDIVGRLRRLLVPFFVWWLISVLPSFPSLDALGGSFLSLLRRPDSGLWFLYALAACQLSVELVNRCCRGKAKVVCATFVALAGCLLGIEAVTQYKDFGYHLIAWYLPFFMAGCALKMNAERLSVRNWPACVPLALVFVWGLAVVFWQREGQVRLPGVMLSVGMSFAYRFAVAGLGVAAFFSSAARFLPETAEGLCSAPVARLGAMTLGIYAVHGFFLRGLSATGAFAADPVGVCGLFALGILLAIVTTLLMKRIPYLRGLV